MKFYRTVLKRMYGDEMVLMPIVAVPSIDKRYKDVIESQGIVVITRNEIDKCCDKSSPKK